VPRPGLSKSKLLSFLQCSKRLWLEVHRPDAAEFSTEAERGFAVGYSVGEVARQLVPGGVLIGGDDNLDDALAETQKQISAGAETLFESTFEHEGVLVRADILTRSARGALEITEVKASTRVKDYQLSDAAIQKWVITQAGLRVDSIAIDHVNADFVYPGDGRYQGLFQHVPVDKEIGRLLREVPKWVDDARRTLAGAEPKIEMGPHCEDPFTCPFQDYCSALAGKTEYPVTILPYGRKTVTRLIAEGYRDIREIPADSLGSENHERVRRVTQSGKPEFDESVREAMRAFPYPRYFMDFETMYPAVPLWKGTSPYQQQPFQWSCHIESKAGDLKHHEFLDTSGNAPMEAFLVSLLPVLGTKGPIFTYNASFERRRLEELAEMFPNFAEAISKVIDRIEDLLPLTRVHYYHPAMKGSWSLKSVMPTIDSSLDYENLDEVQEGGGAQVAYLEILAPETPADRRAKLTEALRRYCRRDTEALVRLAHFLESGK